MKKISRLLISCLCIGMLSSFAPNVFADDVESIKLNTNKVENAEDFKELFFVDGGVTYLPVRLAFPYFGSPEYVVKINPNMSEKNVRIKVFKKDESGELEPEKKITYIRWFDDQDENGKTTGKTMTISYLSYNEKAEDDAPSNDDINDSEIARADLTNPIIFKNVSDDGGQRLFLSLDDLNDIVGFLIGDDNYVVELVK